MIRLCFFFRRSWQWLKLIVPAVGLGLAVMTLGAQPPGQKKPVIDPAPGAKANIAKPTVFKVNGRKDPLPPEKVREILGKVAAAQAATTKVVQGPVKLPDTRLKPLAKEEKHQILRHANPILKNLGLQTFKITDATFNDHPLTLSAGNPNSGGSSLSFLSATEVVCRKVGDKFYDHAYFRPPGQQGFEPSVIAHFGCDTPGLYLVLFHIMTSGASDFSITAFGGESPDRKTVHIDGLGEQVIPVLVSLSKPGEAIVAFRCPRPTWWFYFCELQKLQQ